MANTTWTRYSHFQELAIVGDKGTLLARTPENWVNTMRYSEAVNYNYSATIKLHAGLAYDEGVASDTIRTLRIPDIDRKWLTFSGD
ncbi:Outer membrane protein transport protein (OMPP1/FadL/TodX) [Methylophilaceae bacterium]